ncbi:hypothetical protein ABRP93_07930 [Corynebacterium sp. KPL2850]|uniref:hypothetical protein n=1 Tax=Corynebacterium sp. KPL2850 TaxID=3158318 RepID=UPI0032EB6433
MSNVILENKYPKTSWANSTEIDIQKSLGGDFSLSVGDFVGRSEYYIADSSNINKEFIKVLIRDPENDDIQRRVTGEQLASELDFPCVPRFSPLTSKRIVESSRYPGDYYVVSDFKEGVLPLSSEGSGIDNSIINSFGRFIQSLETIAIPSAFSGRKAADSVGMLYFLSKLEESATLSLLPRGGAEVLSLIRGESDLISELYFEIEGKCERSVFSHGDLKASQLLQADDGSVFVCDWEECGAAPVLSDLSFAAADLFYGQIRSIVDEHLAKTEDWRGLSKAYDEAAEKAANQVLHLVDGYVGARGDPLSRTEERLFEARLGLAGLFRLYTVSAKSNVVRPRELALASIGVQIASDRGLTFF